MTLSFCFNELKRDLKQNGIGDFMFESYCLFAAATGFNRQYLACHGDEKIDNNKQSVLKKITKRRISGEPLQYIIGEWDFCDLSFKVGDGVLIPRPETEILVEYADEFLKANPKSIVFDLCAGTGAVGLTAAKHNPDCMVYLFEKYDKALEFLKINANDLKLNNVSIIKYDILKGFSEDLPKPDLILSNPPYIKTDELNGLQKEVKQEPMTALDGGEDGLVFYRAIFEKWFYALSQGAEVILECGDGQSDDVMSIFNSGVKSKKVIYDFNNIDRAVQIKV